MNLPKRRIDEPDQGATALQSTGIGSGDQQFMPAEHEVCVPGAKGVCTLGDNGRPPPTGRDLRVICLPERTART